MTPWPSPPEDRDLSPHTGYTRAHWEAAADGMLRAALRWASPRGALLDLPGRPSASGVRSDGLEGFARTFLAAACRVAGDGGHDPYSWLERYAEGLNAGTLTPGAEDAESWPLILDHDVQGQPLVEAASVAWGLRLTRPWLWDRLAPEVQDRVAHWLEDALTALPAPNNWYLFPFGVAGFLESVGRGGERTARVRRRALDLLEFWYRGQGWYSDGDGRAFDHYNGWALHLYPVLDAHLSGADTVHGERMAEHLRGFSLMFGGDGAPLYLGRSMTYRFAAASSVALGAVTGHTPLTGGVSRRLLSGSLRYFRDRGAFDDRGLLGLGWHGPHEATCQSYSGPASPYWASKAFLCLLAPPEHPLWTETEGPAPVEGPDRVVSLAAPGLLVQTTGDDGIVRVHNHGSDHIRSPQKRTAEAQDPLYARSAYSTRTGPTVATEAPDNHFAVLLRGRRSARRRIHPLGAGHGDGWGWAASWHRPVFPGGSAVLPALRVESAVVARGADELRLHRVVGADEGTAVESTGWAVDPESSPEANLLPVYGWTGRKKVWALSGTAFAPKVRLHRLTGTASGTSVFLALARLGGSAPIEDASSVVTDVAVDEDGVTFRWVAEERPTRVTFAPWDVVAAGEGTPAEDRP
ncbi:DUF2264 domain-containing protein [Nocardiopsis sp. MG754419]|uniref:DUF2264 domain-containing protein n=1 Tax=Nocardiopsis sp. MG754419 TaxID=2259865 RepID=UPI001BA73A07|nr:DUF2264 domain-containing protein [Nocardiopsis sp. MG754419]MBR8740135.1 hypothetical protein [Nocardiopsis sp. MG754419]